ncbi:hypothetical protein AS159_08975 [Thermotoga sp. Ku-13t]|nr:hypothetical protein AS159_08975 [Thermotoga sp. Ku-13t]
MTFPYSIDANRLDGFKNNVEIENDILVRIGNLRVKAPLPTLPFKEVFLQRGILMAVMVLKITADAYWKDKRCRC